MKKKLAIGLTAAILTGICSSAFAAEPTVEEQQQELEALKARLAVVETQLKAQQAKQKKTDETIKKDKDRGLKFYGDARIRSIDSGDGYSFEQRVRLNFEKKINDDALIRVRAIAMNENEMGTTGVDDVKFQVDNAYMQFNKLYGDKNSTLKIGRFGQSFGTTGYWSSAGSLGMYDGLEFTTGNKLKVSMGFGDWGGAKADAASDAKKTTANKLEKNIYLRLNYNTSKATGLQAWTIRETSADASPIDYEVYGLGVKSKFGKDFKIAADYSRNAAAAKGAAIGKFVTLSYKDADYAVPHSYEARLYYADVDKGNVPAPLNKSINIPCNDVKGPGLSLHYVAAKNVMTEFLMGFNMEKKSTGVSNDNYYRFQVSTKF